MDEKCSMTFLLESENSFYGDRGLFKSRLIFCIVMDVFITLN